MVLLPAGLQDSLSQFSGRDRLITNELLNRFELFGYSQVSPPLMEFEDSLFSGKGEAHQNNSFRVMDNQSGRLMAIRADITPQIERIAIRALETESNVPIRLCYAGQVMRMNPANMGGKRQLRQAGLELIGNIEQINPLEVLYATVESLQVLGLKDLVVSVAYGGIFAQLFDCVEPQLFDEIIKAIHHKDIGALPENTPNCTSVIALLEGDLERAIPSMAGDALICVVKLQKFIADAKNILGANVEIHADALDIADFLYHDGICFSVLEKNARIEIGRGGCYRLGEQYYGCGATLYVDNLLQSPLNYPALEQEKTLAEHDFFTRGKTMRDEGIITILA